MIFNDIHAHRDSEECPAKRQEACMNCGHYWDDHIFWSCYDAVECYKFDQAYSGEQYLTQSMLDSIEPPTMQKIQVKQSCAPVTMNTPNLLNPDNRNDLTDWRTWANVNKLPSECPCGIYRNDCSYHK